ncbi:MAG TPA: hypothetical protein VII95_05005 [Terriglobales bacterium]|jgi:hypothetical protein
MRPQLRSAAILFLLTSIALAADDSLPALKARADAARGGEQAKLCLEYAHRVLEDTNALYIDGDVDKAQHEVGEVVEYAHKAADAASSSGKHLKQTEIDLRKLAKRMHDIAETLSVEDRPPLQKAVEDIEQIRSDLLTRMFGPKAEPKGKP